MVPHGAAHFPVFLSEAKDLSTRIRAAERTFGRKGGLRMTTPARYRFVCFFFSRRSNAPGSFLGSVPAGNICAF